MKVLRYVYPPSGRVSLEEITLPCQGTGNNAATVKTRIEICNLNGEFVYIFNDRARLKNLKLPEGFYLVREKDAAGRIVRNSKLVF
jgi:hypothetical protein